MIQKLPKSSLTWKVLRFTLAQKSITMHLGYFDRYRVTKNFQNRPIWSHCMDPSRLIRFLIRHIYLSFILKLIGVHVFILSFVHIHRYRDTTHYFASWINPLFSTPNCGFSVKHFKPYKQSDQMVRFFSILVHLPEWKLAQKCHKFAKVGSAFCLMRNNPSKISQWLVNFCLSDKILTNQVTLNLKNKFQHIIKY